MAAARCMHCNTAGRLHAQLHVHLGDSGWPHWPVCTTARPYSCCTLACAVAAELEKRHTCPHTLHPFSHSEKICILISRFGDLSEKEPFNPSLRVHPYFLSLPCRFGDLSEKGELVERILQRCANVTYYAS